VTEEGVASDAWRAPYGSYETLTNFIDKKLAGQLVPPRIDTHFLDSYAGSVRPQIMAALKTMGMISDSGASLDPLRQAAKDPNARKAIMKDWAVSFYSEQIALANQAATAQMLWESFSRHGYSGSTLRKAVVFYLALVTELELPTSPHFKAPKAQQSGGTNTRVRRAAKTPEPPSDPLPAQPGVIPQTPGAEVKTVSFGEVGTVTVTTSLRWLELPDDKFVALRKAIRDIEALGEDPDRGVATGRDTEEEPE
jgi:hypothetical protein